MNFEEKLKSALSLEHPYDERLLRQADSRASVLALFGRQGGSLEADSSAFSLLVIRRAETEPGDIRSHSGQMAFPGGRCEADELERCDFAATALRETEEEVGIPRHLVRILGSLPEITTISDYRVVPYVGILESTIGEVTLRPDPAEVAEALWIPWTELTDPAHYQKEMISRGAVRFPTHVYQVQGKRIWGLTGSMIKNLLDRMSRIG